MARNFNGSTDYLQYTPQVTDVVPATVSVWFNLANTTGAKTLFALGGEDGTGVQEVAVLCVGSAFWALEQNISNVQAISSATLAATTWYHGCAVFATHSSRAAYINGANKGTDVNFAEAGSAITPRTRIGQRANATNDQKWNGYIAEIGVWNVALTDAEVAVLATGISPLAVRPASLVAYWPLIGKYSPEIDVVGGFGMALNGTPSAIDHPRVRYPFGHGAR